jgi:antitoxin HicB
MDLAARIAHASSGKTSGKYKYDRVCVQSGGSAMHYKLPLVFEPQPEGGFTVTSPLLPEFITEGDTVEDALENVRDALAAVIEAYQETGRTLPPNLLISDPNGPVWAETVVAIP